MIRTTVDFETFWSKDHQLKKMDPISYVMHPLTQLISASLKHGNEPTRVVFGEPAIRSMLADYDWSNIFAIAHNMSAFDALIMAWRLGIQPKMWGCTLAMARPIHAKTTGLSLAKLVEYYGIGHKDSSILVQTQGKRLEDFTKEELHRMAVYNVDDTEQDHKLYEHLVPHYTMKELWHIDATIRMLVEPGFVVNRKMLEDALAVEREKKRIAVLKLARFMRTAEWASAKVRNATTLEDLTEGVRIELASAPKFGLLLTANGVEVPMKPSKTDLTKMIPALAKTDQVFQEMQDHENPLIATAARARLSVKSTLLESRIEAVLNASELCDGLLPIPINYCGADTTGRDSGFIYNPQNLPAIRGPATPAHSLRMCMEAPPGQVVAVADSSGIELRINHFLWRVKSTMDLYAENPKADLYRAAAALHYHCSLEEVSALRRQLEKTKQLGLGFGSGAKTFKDVARTPAMGGLVMTLEEAQGHVDAWRTMYAEIPAGWNTCNASLQDIYVGGHRIIDPWNMCITEEEGIRLPSGRVIRYPYLRQEEDGEWPDGRAKTSWFYGHGRHKARIYGPKVDENIVQALARDALFDWMLEFFKDTGFRPKLRVHDELAYLFPEREAEQLLAHLHGIMRKPLKWWPELITWSEGDIASAYGLCK